MITKHTYNKASCSQYVRFAREWWHGYLVTRNQAKLFQPGENRDAMMMIAGTQKGRALSYLVAARDQHPNFNIDSRRAFSRAA